MKPVVEKKTVEREFDDAYALEKIKNRIEQELGESPGSPGYNAALVLLASARVGASIKRVAKFVHLPRREVAMFARRLTENGVWKNGRVYTYWTDKELGTVSFLLDMNVALGNLKVV